MYFQWLEYGIWGVSSAVLLLTALQLWRTGSTGTFRIFFAYLCVVGTHGFANLVLSFTDPLSWFYSFYVGGFITTILGFAVLYEAAKAAVSTPLFKLDSSVFLTVCALGTVLAVVIALNTEVQGNAFIRTRILLEVCLRVMQVTVLAVFVAVTVLFGLFWRKTEFGIVLGYGIYAASQLFVMCFRASGVAAPTILVLAPLISYFCASLIWLTYASLKQPALDVDTEALRERIEHSLVAVQRINP